MLKRIWLVFAIAFSLAACGETTPEEVVQSSASSAGGDVLNDEPGLTVEVGFPAADTVIEHLRAQGLPIGRFSSYEGASSPFNKVGDRHLYQGLAIFHDERVGDPVFIADSQVLKFDDSGGIVEIFANREDMDARIKQIEGVRAFAASQDLEVPVEYQVRQGNILLRLGHVMEQWTDEYEAALASYEG